MIMIVYGVRSEGRREVLGVEAMWEGREDSWREYMRKLKRRGVRRVKVFIS